LMTKKRWCDDCTKVQYWTRPGNPPDSFSVCSLGMKNRLKIPAANENPHGGGYYRTNCQRYVPANPEYKPEPCPECGCTCGDMTR